MIRSKAWTLAAAFFCLAAASGQNADEVIERNLQARGGSDRLTALNSLQMKGQIRLAGGLLGRVDWQRMRPRLQWLRIDVSNTGADASKSTVLQGHDGSRSWEIVPRILGGNGQVRDIPPNREAAFTEVASHFEDPFINYAAKGHQVRYAGIEELDDKPLEGLPVHHVELLTASGETLHHYFNAATWLEVKRRFQRPNPPSAAPQPVELFFLDYRKVNGLMLPFRLEEHVFDQARRIVQLDTIVVDPAIDESRFNRP